MTFPRVSLLAARLIVRFPGALPLPRHLPVTLPRPPARPRIKRYKNSSSICGTTMASNGILTRWFGSPLGRRGRPSGAMQRRGGREARWERSPCHPMAVTPPRHSRLPPTARLCLTETKNKNNCLSGYDDKRRIRNWHSDDAGCIPPLVGAAGLVVMCNAAAVAAMVMALAGVPQEVDTTLNTFRVRGTPAAWPPLDPFLSGTN